MPTVNKAGILEAIVTPLESYGLEGWEIKKSLGVGAMSRIKNKYKIKYKSFSSRGGLSLQENER